MNSIDELRRPISTLRFTGTSSDSAADDSVSGCSRPDQRNRVAAGVLLPARGALCGAQHTDIRHPYEPGTWAAADGGDLSETRWPLRSAMVTFSAPYRTRYLGRHDAPRRPVPRACAGVGYDGRIRGPGLDTVGACFPNRSSPPTLMKRSIR